MSKADKLGASASFSAAGRPASARRRLIAQATGDAPADPTRVPLEQLAGNPDNPRDELGDLEELAESLRTHGLRQPVSVMPKRIFLEAYPHYEEAVGEASFVVVNGNRRLAAARLAGLPALAVHLADSQDADTASIRTAALVENIHRKDLEPLEEAAAVRELVEVYGTNAEAARRLGKTRAWVGQRLALLDLRPELQQALRGGELRIKDARRLGTLSAEEQLGEWERLVNPVYSPPPSSDPSASEAGVNPVYTGAEEARGQKASAPAEAPSRPPVNGAAPRRGKRPEPLKLHVEWDNPEAVADQVFKELSTGMSADELQRFASAFSERLA
ncbi:ParB/RepB/Spo0J family partition protein [Nocardiopsis sp. CNT-189]|uniref:ParB/RepB/Spo0J family partition protein n=1 Tax=Nocardiopsis oceanisediminis TaxID=2816862 RepID=UPI003B2AF75F